MKIIGIDEVGRGPLAGPVTVCAVSCDEKIYKILKRSKKLPELGKDSKKLKEKDREKYDIFLKKLSKEGRIDFKIVHISNKIIDSRGISFSIKKALESSIAGLEISKSSKMLLDGGLKAPNGFKNQKTIIKGDEKEKIIAWASILAKVSRDKLMKKISKKYPEYGFEIHKGYGTLKHKNAIRRHGVSSLHRKSFVRS